MKRLSTLIILVVFISPVFALGPTLTPPGPVKASSILFPVGPNKQMISLEDLAYMKPRDYAKITDKHMNLVQRMKFSLAQKKLRNSINADGTVNNKALRNMAAPDMDGQTGFHLGGFALGVLLGPIGVLIAYLINDDKSANRRKWAWIGGIVWLLWFLLVVL